MEVTAADKGGLLWADPPPGSTKITAARVIIISRNIITILLNRDRNFKIDCIKNIWPDTLLVCIQRYICHNILPAFLIAVTLSRVRNGVISDYLFNKLTPWS
jgi:hypothetical protein